MRYLHTMVRVSDLDASPAQQVISERLVTFTSIAVRRLLPVDVLKLGLSMLQVRWWDGLWGFMACESAALFGRLDCLRYVHENGYEWDADTCECAAEKGHLDCLRYAEENRCPEL